MKPNPILSELRRTRENLARETHYDLQQLFDYVRNRDRFPADFMCRLTATEFANLRFQLGTSKNG
jgi:hypothetical protein